MSQAEFVEIVRDAGGDETAAALLWTMLQEWVCVEGFTPHPSDNLERIYGIAEEELDEDLVLAILRELHIQPPGYQTLETFGPVDTPLRVAQLVARCREHGNSKPVV